MTVQRLSVAPGSFAAEVLKRITANPGGTRNAMKRQRQMIGFRQTAIISFSKLAT